MSTLCLIYFASVRVTIDEHKEKYIMVDNLLTRILTTGTAISSLAGIDQANVLKKAHEKAHAEAKKWYLKRPGVRRQK